MAVLFCLMAPAFASAQDRQGGWFGVGGGFGSASVSCDDCGSSSREGSGAGYLRGGWTLSPRVQVGAELDIWAKTFTFEPGTEGTFKVYNFSGVVNFYPAPARPFFVKGGAGVALQDVDFAANGTKINVEVGRGPGVVVGAGYDFRLGRRVALTTAVDYWYGNLGDSLKFAGESLLTGVSHNVLDVTVGITFP
jgi:Outer membrane protein beta-barrel domain